MKKKFTRLLLLFTAVLFSFGAFADDLKPYAVYFPIADYPEFEYGTVTPVSHTSMASMYWRGGDNGYTYCENITFLHPISDSYLASPYGRGTAMDVGSARAINFNFKTPHLNPGKYRIFLGTSWHGGTARNIDIVDIMVDSSEIYYASSDTTGRQFFYSNGYSAPNICLTNYGGSATMRSHDVYLGTVEITESGVHELSFNTGGGTGTNYVFELMSFIPLPDQDIDVTADDATDVTAFEYPKFDNSGQIFFKGDSLKEIDDTPIPTGYYLPYQVKDPSTYSTMYNVTFDAGSYFGNDVIAVKCADDKWTRVVTDTLDANGQVTATVPAGDYYVEVNEGIQTKNITVSSDGTINVGVETANINVSYSPEAWYVGQIFNVWNATMTTLLHEEVIPVTGVLSPFELPVDTAGNYVIQVLNVLDSTEFEQQKLYVLDDNDLTVDNTATKYNVTLNWGADSFGASQEYTIVRSDNKNALYISSTSGADGMASVKLPDGTYYMSTVSGFVFKTFTVAGTDITVDASNRYTLNLGLGKTVAGANISVYLSSSDSLLGATQLNTDGVGSVTGLTNGRFYFNVIQGMDTINPKFTFVIEDADFTVGDPSTGDHPYYMPYPVYFDLANQPEFTFGESKDFKSGDVAGIQFEDIPWDTLYEVIDTTWTYEDKDGDGIKEDTSFVVNYDSSRIDSIVNYDYHTQYASGGISAEATKNAYVWGECIHLSLPPEGRVTFTTPILHEGRYNVYLSNRWGSVFPGRPVIDTTYMDGKSLLVTDGIERSMAGGCNNNIARQFNAHKAGEQISIYLGEALVASNGRHEVTIYSKKGGDLTTTYHGVMWLNMMTFVPVDRDIPVSSSTVNDYEPKIDYRGYATTEDKGTSMSMGTDYKNKRPYIYQEKDPSLYNTATVKTANTFTVNGGQYSAGDILVTTNPIDHWTRVASGADSITGIASQAVMPNEEAYEWAMTVEGIEGSVVLSEDKTITIPEEINTKVESQYTYQPGEDDPDLGTYTFNTVVSVTDNLEFYYPVTGAILYTDAQSMALNTGDTIYTVRNKEDNGKAPVFSFEGEHFGGEAFMVSYTGNSTRLLPAMGMVMLEGNKEVKAVEAGLYPNPAVESVNLVVKDNNGTATYSIINMFGQTVLSGIFTGTGVSVDLGGIPQGLYLVKVISNGTEGVTTLMVK